MGLVDPARLSAKHFFQKIWLKQKEQESVPRSKSEWNQKINEAHLNEWKIIINEWKTCPKLIIPRFTHISLSEQIELHAFSDASGIAYITAIYAVFKNRILFLLKVASNRPKRE